MSANLWGYYRRRKSDGLIMVRCEQCGRPCYLDPDRTIVNAGRYTDKNGVEWIRPFLFFSTCMVCCPPRSFPEFVARMEQTPEKVSKQYDEMGRKLWAEYQAEKERKQHESSRAQETKTDSKALEKPSDSL